MTIGLLRTALRITAVLWGIAALAAILGGVPLIWWLSGLGWLAFPAFWFYFAVHATLALLIFRNTSSTSRLRPAVRVCAAATAWLAVPFVWMALRAQAQADHSAAWTDVFHSSSVLAVALIVVSGIFFAFSIGCRSSEGA
ncbi:hypothetical protein [Streptomyces beijiangensis]|uniref:Uncharacterized protein n=1 Tax=Streptomyces beijiangensis TaxID=163361 RepID=A0A939JE92_9ACTN|nr:hypothetical protein [Streptomyces beijiangensis]MBO0511083.1 hypothetical protein [Streptomyces beijiangensis]